VDARRLLDQASDVLPNARSSLAQIRESVEKFDKLSPRIDEAFREFAELARAGRELVPELRQTNDRVRELLVTQINPAQPGPPGADGNPQRAGLRTTSEKVAQAADEMQIAARSATRLIERLDDIVVENRKKFTEVIDGLNRVLGPENQDALTRTIRNFAEITENVKPASKRLDSAMEKAEEAISRLGDTAVNVDTMIKELRPTTAAMAERGPNLVKNLDEAAAKFNALLTTMNERTPRLLISLEETTTRLNRSLGDVSELVLAVGRSEGTIAKLLGDPALYNNLDCFTASLAKLGPRLDHILRDVEVFADKIARHPEQIGVRGAIRPDSGLKEGAPSVPPRPRLLP
jgi:phospholipid/cholesterol/gamma-HCH transport system substrate-binding protein